MLIEFVEVVDGDASGLFHIRYTLPVLALVWCDILVSYEIIILDRTKTCLYFKI